MLSNASAILLVFKPFKAFLFLGYIIYHLCFENALKRIFRKNNTLFSVSANKKKAGRQHRNQPSACFDADIELPPASPVLNP
jgi:hypothetical protein